MLATSQRVGMLQYANCGQMINDLLSDSFCKHGAPLTVSQNSQELQLIPISQYDPVSLHQIAIHPIASKQNEGLWVKPIRYVRCKHTCHLTMLGVDFLRHKRALQMRALKTTVKEDEGLTLKMGTG